MYVFPGAITGDAKLPRVETIWWFFESVFLQTTESSAVMLAVFGEKPLAVMFTVFVVAPRAAEADTVDTSATRTLNATRRKRMA